MMVFSLRLLFSSVFASKKKVEIGGFNSYFSFWQSSSKVRLASCLSMGNRLVVGRVRVRDKVYLLEVLAGTGWMSVI